MLNLPEVGIEHRAVLWLSGTAQQTRQRAHQLLQNSPQQWHLAEGTHLWLGREEDTPEGWLSRQNSQARQSLGQEYGTLIYDAHEGFDPDAFGALTGTVKAGGWCLLLTPEHWEDYPDPDYHRLADWPYKPEQLSRHFLRHLTLRLQKQAQMGTIGHWSAEMLSPQWPRQRPSTQRIEHPDPPYFTQDQAIAVQALNQQLTQSKTPYLLTADRGRGKSATLGLVAGLWLEQAHGNIQLTAPRPESIETVMTTLMQYWPQAQRQGHRIQLNQHSLQFHAPDDPQLIQSPASLLMVDEAAALPIPMLSRLLSAQSRAILATTLHGYEGNGRGFALRFPHYLDRHYPDWQRLRLRQPIRWQSDDPLEQLTRQLLMLEAEPPKPAMIDQALNTWPVTYERWEPAHLLDHPERLAECFGLLVLAHYRTTPADFRQLLDAPDRQVWIARAGQIPVGLLLTRDEGGFPESLVQAICMGQRRPQGHLLAQSLAFHGGFASAARYRWRRIVRLAIHPNAQRRGIGEALLQQVIHAAQTEQPTHGAPLDGLGTSFGAEAGLVEFWRHCHFAPVRLGLTREQSTGEHALQWLYPLSDRAQALTQQMQARLAAQLPNIIHHPSSQLSTALISRLLQALPLPQLTPQDQIELHYFIEGHRPLLMTQLALSRALPGWIQNGLDSLTTQALIRLCWQQHDLNSTCQSLGFTGQKTLQRYLRQQLRHWQPALDPSLLAEPASQLTPQPINRQPEGGSTFNN